MNTEEYKTAGTEAATAIENIPVKRPEPPQGLKAVSVMREEFYSKLFYKAEYDGILTGIEEIDKSLRGLKGTVTLAGTPKTGKTTFALQLCAGAIRKTDQEFQSAKVKDKVYILFYSLELNQDAINEKLLTHLIASVSDGTTVTGNDIRFRGRGVLEHYSGITGQEKHERANLPNDVIKAMEAGEAERQKLDRFFLRTLESEELPGFETLRKDIAHIKAVATEQTAGTEYTPRYLVVIDHLQLFRVSPGEQQKANIKSTIEMENYLIEEFNRIQKQTENLVILLISQKNKSSFGDSGQSQDNDLASVKGSVNITYVSGTIIMMGTADNFVETDTGTGRKTFSKLIGISAADRFSAGIDKDQLYILNPQTQTFHYIGDGVVSRPKNYTITTEGQDYKNTKERAPGKYKDKYGVNLTKIQESINEAKTAYGKENKK